MGRSLVAILDRQPREQIIETLPGDQTAFINDWRRHPSLFGGVGSGKTFSNVVKGFAFASEYPGSRGLISEPTFPMVRDVLVPTIRDIFGAAEGISWNLNRADYTITFHNGSQILLRSALMQHPELLAGLNLAWFGMDEVALGDQAGTYKILQARIRQKGYPHQGWVTGTPRGLNWVWERWRPKPDRPPSYAIYYVSTEKNPYLDDEFLESLIESYGDTPFAQQELYGRFVSFQGLIYPLFQSSTHIGSVPASWITDAVGGIDIGIQSPSCIEVYGLTSAKRIYGLDEFYQRRCPLERLIEAAADFMKRWKIRIFYMDPRAKEEREFMRRAGLPVVPAPIIDIKPGIQIVTRLLGRQADGKYGIYFSSLQVNLISEFYIYQWKKRHAGADSYVDEPVDENNHAQDATRYALTGLLGVTRGRPEGFAVKRA